MSLRGDGAARPISKPALVHSRVDMIRERFRSQEPVRAITLAVTFRKTEREVDHGFSRPAES